MEPINYTISMDKSKLDIEAVKALLNQTYWASNRFEETIVKSIENSLCYGVYNETQLVGFGRVVTDYATTFWVCDIIIDEKHRGHGLGKRLIEAIVTTESLQGLGGILATKDAHGLYEHYGFTKDAESFMRRKKQ